jgi:hypothetical protein
VGEDAQAAAFEPAAELVGGGLAVVAGDDDGGDGDVAVVEIVDELHGVGVVGDAEIGAHFAAFDVAGVDAQDDFGLVLELMEQAHLDVGVVAGQDAGGVEVEEELAAEFQEELVGGARAFEDAGGLLAQVALVVESGGAAHVSSRRAVRMAGLRRSWS